MFNSYMSYPGPILVVLDHPLGTNFSGPADVRPVLDLDSPQNGHVLGDGAVGVSSQ